MALSALSFRHLHTLKRSVQFRAPLLNAYVPSTHPGLSGQFTLTVLVLDRHVAWSYCLAFTAVCGRHRILTIQPHVQERGSYDVVVVVV